MIKLPDWEDVEKKDWDDMSSVERVMYSQYYCGFEFLESLEAALNEVYERGRASVIKEQLEALTGAPIDGEIKTGTFEQMMGDDMSKLQT